MPYRQQNRRRNLQAANCTSVKIELQLRSKTSEISLKCLTCCDKSRATISSICSSPSCSLLGWCFGSFSRCCTTLDLFSLSLQKCFSSQKKTALHPFFNLSQLHCENQGCAAVTTTVPPPPPQCTSSHHPGETVSVEQLRLSWLAGEVASHKQIRPVVGQWEEGMEHRHSVAKATTFEWVCSGNVARWLLYNRLKGGVWLLSGSDKGSSGEAVEFFFLHCTLFIYIPQLCRPVWVLSQLNT